MPDQIWRKGERGMEPANESAQHFWSRLNLGEETLSNLTKSRNVRHHRKFFALLHLVYPNQDKYKSFEWFLTEIKFHLGHCDCETIDGRLHLLPRSISFASMDQVAFDEFYQRTIDVILEHFVTGSTEEEMRQQVEQVVGFA